MQTSHMRRSGKSSLQRIREAGRSRRLLQSQVKYVAKLMWLCKKGIARNNILSTQHLASMYIPDCLQSLS